MTSELRPCPFCGSAFKIGQEPHDNDRVGGMFYIYHDYGSLGSAARECPIEVYRHFNSEAEAVAAWNTRAEQAAELAKFKALAETLAGALHHRGGPLCPARYYGDEQCTCGVAEALTSYKEQRDAN